MPDWLRQSYDSREEESFSSHGVRRGAVLRVEQDLGAERNWQRVEGCAPGSRRKMMLWFPPRAAANSSTCPRIERSRWAAPQSFPATPWADPCAALLDRRRRFSLARGGHPADTESEAVRRITLRAVSERASIVPDGPLTAPHFLGGRTPLGTITVGVGWASGSRAGWITLGTPVGSGSILNHPMFR
jgi:hypothetical protein